MKESEFEEKTLKRTSLYDGKVIQVVLDQVLLPDGNTAQRELVFHNGAVAVMPFTNDGKLILVRQYRKPIEKTIYEIPAGKIEKDEKDTLAAAKRELEEETGYQAEQWRLMSDFILAPGYSNERIYIYEAQNLKEVENPLPQDEDEFIELVYFTLDEAKQAVKDKKIDDAKTIYAVQYWEVQQILDKK